MPAPHLSQSSASCYPPDVAPEANANVGNYAITENSKCTNALVGATFVQPWDVDYKGKKCLVFVFAVGDLISFVGTPFF